MLKRLPHPWTTNVPDHYLALFDEVGVTRPIGMALPSLIGDDNFTFDNGRVLSEWGLPTGLSEPVLKIGQDG
jgi:hypothetical protein